MPDFQNLTNVLLLAMVGLVLIVGAVLIYRMINSGVRGRKGTRLGISEYYEIDKSRRLVILRRDDVEHLVLLGREKDVVIEIGIPSLMQQQMMPQPEMMPEPVPQLRPMRQPYAPLRPVEPDFQQEDEQQR